MKLIKSTITALGLLFTVTACAGNKESKNQNMKGENMEIVHLTKAEVLKKVYNYEANPSDWKYEGDDKGMPSEALAEKMEEVQEVLRKAMEKDKLSILTGVYTGGGERIWVYYTRTVRVFGERLNEALAPFEMLPISIYTEVDPEWEEYLDMYEMKEWAIE